MLLEVVDQQQDEPQSRPEQPSQGNAFNKLKAKLETTDTKPKNSIHQDGETSASSAIAALSPEEIAQLVVKAVNKKHNNNQPLSSSSHHTSPTESPNSNSSRGFMDGVGGTSSATKNVNAVVGTAGGRRQPRTSGIAASAPVVDKTRSKSTSRRCGRDALYGAGTSSSSTHGRSSSRDRRARSTGRSSHRRDSSTGRQQQQQSESSADTTSIRRRETSLDRGSKTRNSSRERSGRNSSSRERSGRRSTSVDRNSSRHRRETSEDIMTPSTPSRRRLKDVNRDASAGRPAKRESSVDARSRRDRHPERDSSVDRSTRRRARSKDGTAKSSSTTRANSRERHSRSSSSSHNREDKDTDSIEAGGESTPRRMIKKELSEPILPSEGSRSPKSPRSRSERKSSGSRSPRPGKKKELSGPAQESQDFRSPRSGSRRNNSTTDIHKSPRKALSFTSPSLRERKTTLEPIVTPGGSERKAGSSRMIKFEPKAKEKCADLDLEDDNCKTSESSSSKGGSRRGNRMIKFEPKRKNDSTGSYSFNDDEARNKSKSSLPPPPPPPPPPDDLETPEHQSRSKLDGSGSRKSSKTRPPLTPRRNLSSSSSHDERGEIEFPVPIQEQGSSLHIDADNKGFKVGGNPSTGMEEQQQPSTATMSCSEESSKQDDSENEIEDIRSFARSIWDDDSVGETPGRKEGSGGKPNDESGHSTNNDSLSSRAGRRTVRAVNLKGAKNESSERSNRSARSTELGRSILGNSERSNASTNTEGRPLYKTMSENRLSVSSSNRKENDPDGNRRNRGLSSSAHDDPLKNDEDGGFDVVKPAESKWWNLKNSEPVDGFDRPTTPGRTRMSQGGFDRPTTPGRTRMSQDGFDRPTTPGRTRMPQNGFDRPTTPGRTTRMPQVPAGNGCQNKSSNWTKPRHANNCTSTTKTQESKFSDDDAFGLSSSSWGQHRSTAPKGIDAPNVMTQKERVDRKQASSCRKANILESLAGVLEESDAKVEVKNGTARVVLELGDVPLGLIGK